MPKRLIYYGGYFQSTGDYAFKFTIDSSLVSVDQTDFVIYVDMSQTAAHSQAWADVIAGGVNLRAFKSDKVTELPREIVSVDTGAKTGEIWIRYSGTIPSATDTVFYLYPDPTMLADYAVTATYGRNNVWQDYDWVWHMQKVPNVYPYPEEDSSGHAAHSLSGYTGGPVHVWSVNGKIGKAWDYDGGGYAFTQSNVTRSSENLSVGGWVNADTLDAVNANFIIEQRDYGVNLQFILFVLTTGELRAAIYDTALAAYNADDTAAFTTGVDHHVGFTANITEIRLYKDGSNVATTAIGAAALNVTNYRIYVGRRQPSLSGYWDGKMSILWGAPTVFPPDRYATEYNNQNDPSTFYATLEVVW